MPENFKKKLSSGKYLFAFFRLPGSFGTVNGLIHPKPGQVPTINSFINLPDKPGFVFTPFDFTDERTGIFLEKTESFQCKRNADLLSLEMDLTNATKTADIIEGEEFEKYAARFDKAMSLLRSGGFHKIVLSRRSTVPINGPIPMGKLFSDLMDMYPDAFVYAFYIPNEGLWMGASPERLTSWSKGIFSTVSLAGTLPAGTNYAWGEKEKLEQQYVTDYLKQIMDYEGIPHPEIEGPQTQRAGHLKHLKTNISAKLDDWQQLKSLVQHLHPTPAVCGMPKQKALEFILQNEYNRGFYTGTVGIWHPEREADIFVNLRCMKITSQNYCLYAGGGITVDSKLDKEWEETDWKLQVMKAVLPKAHEIS